MIIDYRRQTLLFDPQKFKETSVAIIGLGNIGSHATLTLARLGIQNFKLWDFDTIEEHNLSSQAFSLLDISQKKNNTMKEKIQELNRSANIELFEKFEAKDVSKINNDDIIVIAIDTMNGRKEIYQHLKKANKEFNLLIDSRVGGSQLEIYNCKNLEEWNSTFVDQASQDPCGGRFICYTSIITGAMIANQVKKLLTGAELHNSLMLNVDSLDILKNFKW